MADFIPEGYHTVTPYIYNTGIEQTIEFAKAAFGATEKFRMDDKEGRISHAEIVIGTSPVMMGEAHDKAPMPAMLYMYMEDCDAIYEKALAAGATTIRVPTTEFYGDRVFGVSDPYGNQWWVATHINEPSAEELEQGMAARS